MLQMHNLTGYATDAQPNRLWDKIEFSRLENYLLQIFIQLVFRSRRVV